MGAVRLARAVTGREVVVKFAGAYHGHSDGLLADAGSGLATLAIPASPGVTAAQAAGTVVVPWNDRDAVSRALDGAPGRRPARRAAAGQHGRGPGRGRLPRVPPRRHPETRGAARLRRGDQRLPGRRRRRPAALRRRARPDDARQGAGRRPARRRLRRARGDDGTRRPRRRRLPGGDAVGQPSGGCGRAGDAATAGRRGLLPTRGAHRPARRGAGRAGRRPTAAGGLGPGPAHPLLQRRAGDRLRRRGRLRPRRPRPLLPGDARPRRLPAAIAVRGLVRLARPRRAAIERTLEAAAESLEEALR